MNNLNLKRFEAEIELLEKKPIEKNKILFYGNSYFAYWKDINKQFADFYGENAIINHGFGGATSAELLYYYHRLVIPYTPKILFWTEGANDFEQGYSVTESFNNAVCVFNQAKAANIKLILLSAIETPKAFTLCDLDFINKSREYSKLLENYANENNCVFIDIQPFFYETGYIGNPDKFRNIFREDLTHLNNEGYIQFAGYIKEKLKINN